MCKLLLIPHIPEGKSKNAWRLAKAITPAMTRMDDDGFGYAAVTTHTNKEGHETMFSEKWLYPKDAWSNRLPGEFKGLEAALQGGLDRSTYRHFGFNLGEGVQRPSIKALMLHSRYSTCGGGVENSHPFVAEDKEGPWAALVHNGVVAKEGLRFEQSTCDSEGILNALIDEQVSWEAGNLQKALDKVRGYYAYGFLTLTLEDGWVMDIVKDSTAQLSALFVHEIGAVVYATSAEQVEGACKKLKWKRPRIAKMRSNTRVRYSVNTGAVLLVDYFKSAEYMKQSWHAGHASGQYSTAMGGASSRGRSMASDHWDDFEEAYYKQKGLDAKGGTAATRSTKSSGVVKVESADGKKNWACLDCGETFFSEYGAAACDHGLGDDSPLIGKRQSLTAEAQEVQDAIMGTKKVGENHYTCSKCGCSWENNEDATACCDGEPSNIGGTIDPNTGAIHMTDGSIIELADDALIDVEEVDNTGDKVRV